MMRSLLHYLPLLSALVLGGCTGQSAAETRPAAGKSTSPSPPEARPASPPASEAPKASVAARELVADAKAKSVTFDDIKLELKKGDPFTSEALTPKVQQLDGKLINIRGYILPSFQQDGIKQFVLVRDNQECCFGPGALLHDCVLVEMTPPAAATYTVRPVSVEGVFTIHELRGPDGKHLAIYHLDGKEVK